MLEGYVPQATFQGHLVTNAVDLRAMLQRRYDLHTHTTASDGSLSPTALVQHAKDCEVDVLAVTDHDITLGLSEARDAARQCGIEFVPGIEISVTWSGQTLHILGLHIDPLAPDLLLGLESIHNFRQERAVEIGRRLDKAGIAGSYAGAMQYAGGKIISRTHFARFLVAKGYAKDLRQVFKRYLVHNKPGYVPGKWVSLEQAVNWIKLAGGLAVIAHPARYKYSATRLRQLLEEFRDLGGVGLEVVSGSHSADDATRFAQLANKMGFYASRGSDYHGPEQAYADPRRLAQLPPSCTPLWESVAWHLCVQSQQNTQVK